MNKASDLAGRNTEDDDTREQTLRRLLALYCDSAQEQTARLSRLAARADEHAKALADCWKVMQAATHRMAGTAQSLGLAAFGGMAAKLDDKIDAMIAGDIGAANLSADVALLAAACDQIDPHDASAFANGPLAAVGATRRRYGADLALRDATILVADDDIIARELVRAILLEEGAREVISVRNGQEALQQGVLANPTVIIADWRMNPVSGRELLHQIRSGQSPMLTSTPFVMLTRVHAVGGKRAVLEEGADYFLEKPFTRESLLSAVHAAMGRSANDSEAPAPRQIGSAA